MSGSAHPGRRRPKKHVEEEHENHERWLVSYADMVTLLMCLFIVLFAMSQVDKAKFAALNVEKLTGWLNVRVIVLGEANTVAPLPGETWLTRRLETTFSAVVALTNP